MLAAFHLNLTALSWIALVVGLFLVYNTVTISVIARREEIGTLRALGATRRHILWLFLGEAAVLGLAGTIAGTRHRARARRCRGRRHQCHRQHAVHRDGGGHAGPRPAGSSRSRSPSGCRSRSLAAWVPAREASRVPPTAAIRGSRPDRIARAARLASADRAVARACRSRPSWPRSARSTASRSSATPRRS